VKSLSIGALFVISSFAAYARDDAKTSIKKLDGTWKPVSAEFAGAAYPDKILKTMKLTVDGEKYKVEIGEELDEGTVFIDPEKSPKELDIKGGEKGPNAGKTFLCIYKLDGEELEVCYDLSGKARPTEFVSKKDTKLFRVTYKRQKS
jgi:uncharacterized protein (TIGR03067 family)